MSVTDVETDGSARGATATPGPQDVSLDTVFMILKNSRRRAVLRYLVEVEAETTLDTLAEHIAAAENGIDVQALSSSQRKRLYIGLYQAHLPKMDDAGVIEFDKHRGRVELRSEAKPVVAYLRTDPDGGPTPTGYLAIAVVTAGAIAIASSGGLAGTTALALGIAPFLAITLHCFVTSRRDRSSVGRPTAGGP